MPKKTKKKLKSESLLREIHSYPHHVSETRIDFLNLDCWAEMLLLPPVIKAFREVGKLIRP